MGDMTMVCEWCKGKEAPFSKLNIEHYGDNKFICKKCIKTLEYIQKLEDDLGWVR